MLGAVTIATEKFTAVPFSSVDIFAVTKVYMLMTHRCLNITMQNQFELITKNVPLWPRTPEPLFDRSSVTVTK